MTGEKIYEAANKFAPIELKDMVLGSAGYDNSGMLLPAEGDVTKVLVTLDLTPQCVEYARKNGYGMIITHHPAIYRPLFNLCFSDAVLNAVRAGIGLASMHLNLDAAPEGIDWCLAKALGAKKQNILKPVGENAGLGRLFSVDKTDLPSLKQKVMEALETENVMIYGDRKREIRRLATFCGAGFDQEELDLCGSADAIVSADIKHHIIREALNRGKCIVQTTHFASENCGMKYFAAALSKMLSDGGVKVAYYGSMEF